MNKIKTSIVSLFLLLLCLHCGTLRAQVGTDNDQTQPKENWGLVNRLLSFASILDGDTIPLVHLKPVVISTKWSLLTDKEIRRNQKLIRNVKKTLPYAKEARRRLQELEGELANMPAKKRKEYVKQVEQQMLDEFSYDLERLTFSQGKVLLKLIDRETGNNSYTLVADLRGSFRASFYNTFARLFGFNLKERYDPKHNKDDALLERIVRSVELGKL